jgi:hypothetical protein
VFFGGCGGSLGDVVAQEGCGGSGGIWLALWGMWWLRRDVVAQGAYVGSLGDVVAHGGCDSSDYIQYTDLKVRCVRPRDQVHLVILPCS